MDAHGMAVSTERSSCTCVCMHQTEKRQVGAQQDLTVTCASCETCPFFGVAKSVVEHMKKQLFEFTVQGSKKNWQLAKYPNDPMQVSSLRTAPHAAWFQERYVKHACKDWASQRVPMPATIVIANGAGETAVRAASEHCAASCTPFACAKIQKTNGQVGGIHSYVCCLLCCILCVVVIMCECVVACRARCVCVGGVGYVMCEWAGGWGMLRVRGRTGGAWPRMLCALRVRCHACRACCAFKKSQLYHNKTTTYRQKRKHTTNNRKHFNPVPRETENIPLQYHAQPKTYCKTLPLHTGMSLCFFNANCRCVDAYVLTTCESRTRVRGACVVWFGRVLCVCALSVGVWC